MIVDHLRRPVSVGSFLVIASSGIPRFAKVLDIEPHKVRVAAYKIGLYGPKFDKLGHLYKTKLCTFALQPGEQRLWNAVAITPEGVPSEAMDLLDKVH